MKIRVATTMDVPALVALNRSVHAMHAAAFPDRFRQAPPDSDVAQAFKAAIEAPTSYWLLAEEEQPHAYLGAEFIHQSQTWYGPAHQMCYLSAIVVAPAFRRTGVARALLANLQTEANARGVHRVDLDVWAFNDEARKAFAHLGFRPVMEKMTLPVRPS